MGWDWGDYDYGLLAWYDKGTYETNRMIDVAEGYPLTVTSAQGG